MDSNAIDSQKGRKRSRSPHRDDRSPSRRKHHHHHHGHHRTRQEPQVRLPYARQSLKKGDFQTFKPLFAEYLDVQKQLSIDDLTEDEIKGRFKSFVGKWNRKELAEGWYEPGMMERAVERWQTRAAAADVKASRPAITTSRAVERHTDKKNTDENEHEEVEVEDEEEDDNYGPSLPKKPSGPSIPSLQDLQHRSELLHSDRSAHAASRRHSLLQDHTLQKERLLELAPRADPGSRERQLEKKREVTATNRSFGEAKEAGMEEVGEGELMGGDDGEGGIAGYKAKLKAKEKVKNEREIRKEEVLRARAAEREERIAAHRQKEDKTMEMLRGLARERFG
ncbi:unnamed protein product [Zymoseptoria tritici ST99CH_3D7]|uniref:RNA helicase HEL117 n=1 Tax=Zymoseptoria tritici (strain ST99CH_3D7) TaxID=1276538 RepID=A0A1X7RIP6_ZYMT9|nr:unnamed protein product [Zymoseptoria tritici ST99CH_3D7]